jgi:hypothetical protein
MITPFGIEQKINLKNPNIKTIRQRSSCNLSLIERLTQFPPLENEEAALSHLGIVHNDM